MSKQEVKNTEADHSRIRMAHMAATSQTGFIGILVSSSGLLVATSNHTAYTASMHILVYVYCAAENMKYTACCALTNSVKTLFSCARILPPR